MKWFSIKKFKPPTSTEMLVRMERLSGHYSFERYVIASLEMYHEDNTKMNDWILAYDLHTDLDLGLYSVTHFALIDPVELNHEI